MPAGRVGGSPELNRLLYALWRLSAHLGSVQLTTRLVPGPPGLKAAALAQAVHMQSHVSHWLQKCLCCSLCGADGNAYRPCICEGAMCTGSSCLQNGCSLVSRAPRLACDTELPSPVG